mmetsp:Transcript_4472/g.13123  ORF Transcript_4472/g.13123 Transcript_4472/m.13123 type:complete len:212 (-) Transcript_4472:83-718(-)
MGECAWRGGFRGRGHRGGGLWRARGGLRPRRGPARRVPGPPGHALHHGHAGGHPQGHRGQRLQCPGAAAVPLAGLHRHHERRGGVRRRRDACGPGPGAPLAGAPRRPDACRRSAAAPGPRHPGASHGRGAALPAALAALGVPHLRPGPRRRAAGPAGQGRWRGRGLLGRACRGVEDNPQRLHQQLCRAEPTKASAQGPLNAQVALGLFGNG